MKTITPPVIIWPSNGKKEYVDIGTTLGDLCRTFPNVFLIEEDYISPNTIKSHRKLSYQLENGKTYIVYDNITFENNILFKVNSVKTIKKNYEKKEIKGNIKPKSPVFKRKLKKNIHEPLILQDSNIRKLCINEVIDTEIKFNDDLCILLDIYYQNFIKQQDSSNFISFNEIKSIFQDIQVIYNVSSLFLTSLQEEKENNPLQIGKIFLEYIDMFKCFGPFISTYPDKITLIKSLKTNSDYISFINNLEIEYVDRLHNNTFTSFLIHPAQRLAQYITLIDKILSNTPKNHSDYNNIVKSKTLIQNLVSSIDIQSDNLILSKEVLKIINNIYIPKEYKSLIQNQPYRNLIFQQNLKVRIDYIVSEYTCYSFSDCILITKEYNSNTEYTYKLISIIPIKDIRELQMANGISIKFSQFEVNNTITIYPKSDEFIVWVNYFGENNLELSKSNYHTPKLQRKRRSLSFSRYCTVKPRRKKTISY